MSSSSPNDLLQNPSAGRSGTSSAGIDAPPLALYSWPKSFADPETAAIQRRAIQSWLNLSPRPEIFLFGNEPGVEQICNELRLVHIPAAPAEGTARIGNLAAAVEEYTRAGHYLFASADLSLTQNLFDTIWQVSRPIGWFRLITGDATQPSTAWNEDLRQLALAASNQRQLHATDLVFHRRDCLDTVRDVVVDRDAIPAAPKWFAQQRRESAPGTATPLQVPSISVIVPHHNRSDFVLDALLSIRAQTVQPTEVIVVDDASRPEHRRRLESYAGLATILHTPRNLGISGARNYGVAHSRGEWLAFLDDDDVYVPDKLESQLRYLQAHPECDAIGSGLTMVASDGRREYWGNSQTGTVTLSDALTHTASMAQALLIRRDVFQKVGGYDESCPAMEDYEFGIRLVAAGYRLDFIGEPLFMYRRGGRDQITRQWTKMFTAELGVVHRHMGLFRQRFGALGAARATARILKRHGLLKGGVVGRSIWAAGCLGETVMGPIPVTQS